MLKNKTKTSQYKSESASTGISKTHAFNRFVRRVIIRQQMKSGRIRVMLLVLVVLLTIYYLSFVMDSFDQPEMSKTTISTILEEPKRYLTQGSECKIPDIDPFAKDVMTLFHKESHM